MRFRQVHLDFHNHQAVGEIGSRFSRKQFQEALKVGKVDHINLFAKCHHGYSYHPTEVGLMHPGLSFDLLGEQLTACNELGVSTAIYLSAGLDEYYARISPGVHWVRRAEPGSHGEDPLQVGFKRLCVNTPYLEYLCRQVEEVLERFDCTALFLDIVGIVPCVCPICCCELRERDMDPLNPNDRVRLGTEVQQRYFKAIEKVIEKTGKPVKIIHNAGHIPKGNKTFMEANSHIELESLPTGGWGYDHFPISGKYIASLGMDYLGMTGKFHTTWGEFGGFKHRNALRYECAVINAYGGRCCVGDQLHPDGLMNPDTYRLIGEAFTEVANRENLLVDAQPVSRIAILSIESLKSREIMDPHLGSRNHVSDLGAARMLMERQVMFDVIDDDAEFGCYELILLPDEGRLDQEMEKKLATFLDGGGKLLLSFASGMRKDADEFCFGLGQFIGHAPIQDEFLRVRKDFLDAMDTEKRLVESPFYLTGGSVEIDPPTGATIFADRHPALFNRTYKHFCSHQHAPEGEASTFPGGFIFRKIGYLAPRIFAAYADRGQMLYRDLIYTVISKLMGYAPGIADMPSAGRVSLMEQQAKSRYLLHLIYASPIRRGDSVFPRWGLDSIEVIEDVVPLHDVACELHVPKKIISVELPNGEGISFKQERGVLKFRLPLLDLSQTLILSY